jgi:hypothetical protein
MTAPSFRADARTRPLCGFPKGEGQQDAGRGSAAAGRTSAKLAASLDDDINHLDTEEHWMIGAPAKRSLIAYDH